MENEYLEKAWRALSQADQLELLRALMVELGFCTRCLNAMPCMECGAGL